jgi:uncharacterized protein (DUF427 family)
MECTTPCAACQKPACSGYRGAARGLVRVERGAKRVRAYLGGALVADTLAPLLVWEVPYFPTYYFPADDVQADLIDEGADPSHSPSRGEARRGERPDRSRRRAQRPRGRTAV